MEILASCELFNFINVVFFLQKWVAGVYISLEGFICSGHQGKSPQTI